MVWAKLDDGYPDRCAPLSDAAFRTHTEGLSWTMRRLTEGRITERDLRRFAETDDPEAAVKELTARGAWMWHPDDDGSWLIVWDMDYQRTPGQVEADRAANTERQQRWRQKQAKKRARAAAAEEPFREDVERICDHLAGRIEANGSKRPGITKTWRTEARLLLDTDGRTEEQVITAIDWCQANSFWHSKILSMPKLREKYDQLRLQAGQERKGRNSNNGRPEKRGGARQEILTDTDAANLDKESVV